MSLSLVSTASVLLAAVTPALAAPGNRILKRDTIPDYALTYAPYTYLYSGEEWFQSDIATHCAHMSVEYNYVNVSTSVTVETLDTYNSSVFLTSYDNVEDNPSWLLSTYGISNDDGYSAAPATIIAVDKTDYVDVFYFYFYSYNHGSKVLGTQLDNHVGDWEHSMIRFTDGTPEYVYYSAHSGGAAYTYAAVNKTGVRPIVYSATGSHANYATPGVHDIYAIIGNIVTDTTDAGYYWDVTQNYRGFWFDNSTSEFTSAGGADVGGTEQDTEGVDWLYWLGRWGDEQYPDSDSRQDCILDIDDLCHYQSGPTGPYDKNLGRTAVCQDEDDCDINDSLSE